jgi:hypothetical protein
MGLVHVPKQRGLMKESVLLQTRFLPLIPIYQDYCHYHPSLRHYIHWAIHVHSFQNVINEIPQ